jgi:transcriptional regulator with PAS, ATPase and Fis domain
MRMMGLDFVIPPLRERMAELPAFVALFLSRKSIVLPNDAFDALIARLQKYQWPGNVRQLFKCLEAWLLYCELDGVQPTADNFPLFKDLESQQKVGASAPISGDIDFNQVVLEDRDLEQIVSDFERVFLSNAIKRHSTISALSKAINVPRSTLDAKRRKYNLV